MKLNNPQVLELVSKWKGLSARERALACLFGCVLIFMLGNAVILKPLSAKIKSIDQQKSKLQDDLSTLTGRADAIHAIALESIHNPVSKKNLSYKNREADADKALAEFYDELVTPKEMTSLLRQMINDDKKLTLVSLESLPLIDVMAQMKISENLLKNEEAPKLYRRGVVLTFRGNFFEVLNYLKKIEDLPKRLIWGELSYTVTNYPIAEVKLTVYTLTNSEEWVSA